MFSGDFLLDVSDANSALIEVGNLDIIRYPWEGLENSHAEVFPMIGYGSLLSFESASRTLKHTDLQAREFVKAFGLQRIFNYEMPQHVLDRWEQPVGSSRIAALNVTATGSPEDWINAVLIPVSPVDISALRERELNYDLRPIPIQAWGDTGPFRVAWVLIENVEMHRRSSLLPHPNYTSLCRDACAQLSEDFLKAFDDTTLLADGKTKLGEFLRDEADSKAFENGNNY